MYKYLAANGTPTAVLSSVGRFLHRRGDQSVGTEQMSLQSLVSEETALTFLAVQRWPVVNHFRVDLDLVDPLHMMTQLLQILCSNATAKQKCPMGNK